MTKAPDGFRVGDSTHYRSGPTCPAAARLSGADTITVERPGGGGITRQDPRGLPDVDDGYFTMPNASMRSLTLHTRHPVGREILSRFLDEVEQARAAGDS